MLTEHKDNIVGRRRDKEKEEGSEKWCSKRMNGIVADRNEKELRGRRY